ncbi:unnamed protein product, partial [Meganyctiphanes norvegica]
EQYGVCNKNHHLILHDIFKSNNSFVNFQSNTIRQSGNVTQTKRGNGCLLPIGAVKRKNYSICTLYDCGADLSLMTHHLAKYLNLNGSDVELIITKVGNVVEKCQSMIYNLTLVDFYGKEWHIDACGIDEITSELIEVNMNKISQVLNVNVKDITRPRDQVELLIVSDYCSLMPQVVKNVDNLQSFQNTLGLCVRVRIESNNCNVKLKINTIANHISFQ